MKMPRLRSIHITFLLLSVSFVFIACTSEQPKQTVGSVTPPPTATSLETNEDVSPIALDENVQVENFMRAYLEEITQGENGSGFFCQQEDVTTFFSPRSFEILKAEMYDTIGQAVVRLDSSNEGGMPITNHWKFSIHKGEPQYAALLGDVGKYGICISMVFENN